MANDSNGNKTQLTIKEWIRETNALAVFTLFLLGVLAATFSIQDKVATSVDLRLVTNATTTKATSKLHIGAVFVVAILFQLLGHAVTACKAASIETKILNNDKLDSRALALSLSFPLLHAAVLVGVAQVIDTWAVFSSFLLTFLILIIMYLFGKSGNQQSKIVIYLTTTIIIILYFAFWILAWKSGETTKIRTAQLGGFTGGLVLLLLIYFFALHNTAYRIKALAKKKIDGDNINEKCFAIILQEEALYVCVSVGFAMVAVTTWICYTSAKNPGRKVAIAVSISALLQFLLSLAISQRLRYVVFDKTQLESLQQRFMQESIYVTNSASQVGIDSDSETNSLDNNDTLNLIVPS